MEGGARAGVVVLGGEDLRAGGWGEADREADEEADAGSWHGMALGEIFAQNWDVREWVLVRESEGDCGRMSTLWNA